MVLPLVRGEGPLAEEKGAERVVQELRERGGEAKVLDHNGRSISRGKGEGEGERERGKKRGETTFNVNLHECLHQPGVWEKSLVSVLVNKDSI